MDPHTAAELDLDQIHNLVDDLLEAHGSMIPNIGARKPELLAV
jgi:alpha-galactosidase